MLDADADARVFEGAEALLTHAHQAVASHRTWTCTTRRGEAGQGIPQVLGKLGVS